MMLVLECMLLLQKKVSYIDSLGQNIHFSLAVKGVNSMLIVDITLEKKPKLLMGIGRTVWNSS